MAQPSVAVIGLGAQGVNTVKNLLEQGFTVTGFDRNSYIGGIWHYSAENHVSALPTTVVNISRERGCFTDFAFPPGTDSYPNSAQVDKYLNDYVDAFELRPHLRLSTRVDAIERDDTQNCWHITVSGPSSAEPERLRFDKVVMATGPHNKPVMPDLPGQERFKGEILHSIAFKDPKPFQGKCVMIVGASNSAADTATSLVGVASKVYLSHRHGANVMPRHLKNGNSLDHALSYRQFQIKDATDSVAPWLSMRFLEAFVNKTQREEFGTFDPQWRLQPAPSLLHQSPTISETLIPALREGTITSTHAPKCITGDWTVELQDGSILTVDSIIFCTGYSLDYSTLGRYDPTLNSSAPGGHTNDTPRLYQNIFSLDHPESLAFVGVAIIIFPAFLLSDLASMAIAALWSNRPETPSLPSQQEMEQWYAEHLAWVSSIRALSPDRKSVRLSVRSRQWLPWVTDKGGCNIDNHLGYFSPGSWKLWWHDRLFYNLLAYGIYSPHVFRLFESSRPGGRRKWDGAREAIVRVNEDVRAGPEKRRKERA
jgi:dimethylaniline monooxygenase (N-oxide forming)